MTSARECLRRIYGYVWGAVERALRTVRKLTVHQVTAFATLLLAFGTAWLARDASRQIGIMENDQRPWIKVETEIAGPLDFTHGFVYMPLRLTLANVGKSPAFNIRPGVWGSLAFSGHNDPQKEQAQTCARFRGEPLDNPARGFILFPGDRVPWEQMGGGHMSGVGFSPQDIQRNLVDENGRKVLGIWILGCVDYVFGEPTQHHQTGLIYSVGQIIPREGMEPALTFSIAPQGSIPSDKLRLILSPSGSGQTD